MKNTINTDPRSPFDRYGPTDDFEVVHPQFANNRLRQRNLSNETYRINESLLCERVKTNLIYFLLIIIVILVGGLCYTLVIVFEEKYDVLEPTVDDVLEVDVPVEQRTWYDMGIQELRDSIKFKRNKKQAKNVILFVGDGMGLSTVTASRLYKYGEEGLLSWESFEHFGLLKVSIHSIET